MKSGFSVDAKSPIRSSSIIDESLENSEFRAVNGQPAPYRSSSDANRSGEVSRRVIDELCMGLRPTRRDENRFEPKPLPSNWRGTAKIGATLDLLRPMTSLVWDACLNQSVSRQSSRWDVW
jgi:hypothetical protein